MRTDRQTDRVTNPTTDPSIRVAINLVNQLAGFLHTADVRATTD